MEKGNALTAAQLRELERELRSTRARLERMMVQQGSEDTPRRRPGDPDGARANGDERTIDQIAVARHRQLVEALRRLESGQYGHCERCAQPIPYGRLLLVPEATRCVTCARVRA